MDDDEFLTILASLEKLSEHPIAHAIIENAEEKKLTLRDVADFEIIQGK